MLASVVPLSVLVCRRKSPLVGQGFSGWFWVCRWFRWRRRLAMPEPGTAFHQRPRPGRASRRGRSGSGCRLFRDSLPKQMPKNKAHLTRAWPRVAGRRLQKIALFCGCSSRNGQRRLNTIPANSRPFSSRHLKAGDCYALNKYGHFTNKALWPCLALCLLGRK